MIYHHKPLLIVYCSSLANGICGPEWLILQVYGVAAVHLLGSNGTNSVSSGVSCVLALQHATTFWIVGITGSDEQIAHPMCLAPKHRHADESNHKYEDSASTSRKRQS